MEKKTGGEGAGIGRRLSVPPAVPLAVLLILLCGFGLYSTAPPASPGAGRLILDRAERILGAAPPGEGQVLVPSSSAWISYLTAAVQETAFRISPSADRASFLRAHRIQWMRILRGVWSLLAAFLAGVAAWAAGRLEPAGSRGGIRGKSRQAMPAAALAAGLLLLVSPLPAVGIRDLASFVPAGLVSLWLMDSALHRRTILSLGIPSGLILAWFPFLWPLVLLALGVRALASRDLSQTAASLLPALVLGLALEPRHLMELGSLARSWPAEWLRGWGWNGPGSSPGAPGAGVPGGAGLTGGAGAPGGAVTPRILSLLGLIPVLGLGAWVLWVPGWVVRRREPAPVLMSAGVWGLMVLLPVLGGLRGPVEAQYSAAAILAVWSGASLASLIRTRSMVSAGRAGLLAGGVALLIAALALPGRLGLESAVRRSGEIRAAVLADLHFHVAPGQLWLSDTDLAGGEPGPGAVGPAGADGESGGGGSGLPDLGMVLPRDSRSPGRYDFAYWPRWYAGFRWVLLSSSRVRENLGRADADVPQGFYRSLQANADLVQSWGEGTEEGYRLYRIREGSTWRHPLTEEELAGLSGQGGRLTWFLGQLGALYMKVGDLGTSALLFRQGIEWDPEAVSLYNNLGAAYLREGEFAEAARAFEQGLRADPRSFELLYNFALACADQGLDERAERLLRQALTVRPDYAPIHYELARIFLGQGRVDAARAALTRFLELAPNSPRGSEARRQLRILEGDSLGGGS